MRLPHILVIYIWIISKHTKKKKAPRRVIRLGVVDGYSILFHMLGEVITQQSTTRTNAITARTIINVILPVSESSSSSQEWCLRWHLHLSFDEDSSVSSDDDTWNEEYDGFHLCFRLRSSSSSSSSRSLLWKGLLGLAGWQGWHGLSGLSGLPGWHGLVMLNPILLAP